MGMYPIDYDAESPNVPNQERIFAAALELQQAYERDEEWTRLTPLHESMVLLTLTAVEDGLREIANKWNTSGRTKPFPDVLAAIDEIMRIVSKEGKEEYESSLQRESSD